MSDRLTENLAALEQIRAAAYEQGRADERKRLLCDREKHRRTLNTRHRGSCWVCEQEDREAACDHSGPVRSDWAGILGYRYYCGQCGASVPDPERPS